MLTSMATSKLLGLRGVVCTIHTLLAAHKDIRDTYIKKINKMHVHMYDEKWMITRAWLYQLQTYFTLSPNMVEEDAIHFASLHFEGDALKWW